MFKLTLALTDEEEYCLNVLASLIGDYWVLLSDLFSFYMYLWFVEDSRTIGKSFQSAYLFELKQRDINVRQGGLKVYGSIF